METPPIVPRPDLTCEPLDLIERWPSREPMVLLRSGSVRAAGHPWTRWSIVARPERWVALDAATAADPIAALDRVLAATRLDGSADDGGAPLPFLGGWVGGLSYDLGRVIEPAARHEGGAAAEPRPWPLIALARCPAALVHDHRSGAWHAVGDAPWLADVGADAGDPGPPPRVGAWTSSLEPDGYLAAVARTLEYVGAGDIFQASIAQRLTAPFSGSPRRLAARALAESDAWYGAYLELPDARRVISMSPELFLEVTARTRAVVTRPIKGTRPGHAAPGELLASEKDAAELHMIVDLMRNDLGRVAEFGSVRVPRARMVESHPTVHHGVGEVRAVLREDVSPGELLRATFPPGSVTGAPKIRAMQIIDELEPVRRGPYCGAFGYFSDSGDVCLNVGIRTMLLHGGRIDYSVGGGIVADSDPLAEYRESLDKAAVLRLAMRSLEAPAARR
jgi:para-aminobenzoate synthetase component 1